MTVSQRISFFVTNGFEELVDPDTGVDGETFAIEGFEFCGTGGGRDDCPEAGDTHNGRLLDVAG